MPIDFDMILKPAMALFGQPVTYMPAVGSPFPAVGIFDAGNKVVVIFEDGPPGSQTTKPTLGIQLSAFPVRPVAGDRVQIPSVNSTFYVNEIIPDSHGGMRLELNFQSSP